jgi:predicted DsbA family dithiol-disulfide isomerase
VAIASELEINATPGFVINGYRLLGAHPLRRFERLIRLSLEDAQASSTSAQTTAL